MPSQIPYTSTLPVFLMRWLEDASKQQKTTKKAIIVQALTRLREVSKKEELSEGFKRAAHDAEILEMAEEGLDDSLDQLERFSL